MMQQNNIQLQAPSPPTLQHQQQQAVHSNKDEEGEEEDESDETSDEGGIVFDVDQFENLRQKGMQQQQQQMLISSLKSSLNNSNGSKSLGSTQSSLAWQEVSANVSDEVNYVDEVVDDDDDSGESSEEELLWEVSPKKPPEPQLQQSNFYDDEIDAYVDESEESNSDEEDDDGGDDGWDWKPPTPKGVYVPGRGYEENVMAEEEEDDDDIGDDDENKNFHELPMSTLRDSMETIQTEYQREKHTLEAVQSLEKQRQRALINARRASAKNLIELKNSESRMELETPPLIVPQSREGFVDDENNRFEETADELEMSAVIANEKANAISELQGLMSTVDREKNRQRDKLLLRRKRQKELKEKRKGERKSKG